MVDHGTVPPKPPEAMKSLVIQQQVQNKAVVNKDHKGESVPILEVKREVMKAIEVIL